MAVIRNISHGTYETTYVPTAAFFCAITCTTILMLKFRGFKASFNLLSRKKGDKEHYEKGPDMPVLGAYRSNREEYFGHNNSISPRIITPSMVKLPQKTPSKLQPSKSTSDLSKHYIANIVNIPESSRKSTSDISASSRQDKKSKEIKKQDKEQKLEKQKMAEQRKTEKLAHEQEIQKLKREKGKQESSQKQLKQKTIEKTVKKKPQAPQPPVHSSSQTPVQYSSNTLERSISRSSGPPPYSAVPEVVPNHNDSTGNTSFGKPVDGPSSWDLISQHRQQLNRPLTSQSAKTKSTVLDLQYNVINVRN